MDVQQTLVAYGTHRRQYAVVVRARHCRPGRIAFYFHGGAWTFGRPETFVPAATPWLEAGFTVILPSYRRLPEVGLDGVVADCWSAVRHFCPQPPAVAVHLGGISAGAHLAALLAAQPQRWHAAGWSVSPSKVLCCAGPLNFSRLRFRPFFLPRYAHLDAIRVLPPAPEQPSHWCLLHGTGDRTVNVSHSRSFRDRLLALGYPVHLREIPDGTHLAAGRWMFGETAAETVTTFLRDDAPATGGVRQRD